MKKIILSISIILMSCSPQVNTDLVHHDTSVDSLEKFFQQCQSDLVKATQVVIENDLIKNLSHLQHMNYGGKKYYLLERENITKMINSVTEGVYSDYILINKEGKIIYTRKNDEIFGKNVKTSLIKNTVLNMSYENRNIFPYIGDSSKLSTDDPAYYITVSSKVKGGDSLPGIFILQINIAKIEELLSKKSYTLGKDGTYKIIRDRTKINTPYDDFNKIDLTGKNKTGPGRVFLNSARKRVTYTFFRFSNLRWIILTEQ